MGFLRFLIFSVKIQASVFYTHFAQSLSKRDRRLVQLFSLVNSSPI